MNSEILGDVLKDGHAIQLMNPFDLLNVSNVVATP